MTYTGNALYSLDKQFVYMAMMEETPYRVKIGKSGNPMVRETDLFSAGVPAPYHMLHVWQVENMGWVEKGVLEPELEPFRVFDRKEIYNLDWMYPSKINAEDPEIVNGLTLANILAGEIDALFNNRGIAFRRWTINECEQYDFLVQEQKRFR